VPVEIWIAIGIPILLLVGGRLVGSAIERRNDKSIAERETRFKDQPALSTKHSGSAPIRSATLATGSVVISVDYVKRFLGGLRMIFGGEIRPYSSLLDRARREAILRMKESQPDADVYVNTRLETSNISSSAGREAMGAIEVVAYATAIRYDRSP
jgi:uncharacterized protein YbjQ (UPF0145 family)